MYKNKLMGALLLPLALGSCSGSKNIAVRAMPLPETMRVSDSEGLAKGRMMFERGEFALAADAFRRAVRLDPASADAYNGLAASYDQLGRYDLSRRFYELALAQTPEDGRILRNFARSMLAQGNRLAARQLIAEATALAAGRPEAVRAVSPDQQPTESTQITAGDDNRPFESGQGAVTIAIAPEAPAPLAELPAREPVVQASAWFQRISASVIQAFPGTDGTVHVTLDPPSRPPVPSEALAPITKLPRLHIMNAVGRKHQAARMRSYLASNGWSGTSTGDSRVRLFRSRILFRTGDETAARKLAESLPFQPRLQPSRRAPALFLMLGRDAVGFDNQLRAPKQS